MEVCVAEAQGVRDTEDTEAGRGGDRVAGPCGVQGRLGF